MTDSPVRALLPLGLVMALGCSDSSNLAPVPPPPPGYAFAFASPDCAPWDGPAIFVVLAQSRADSLEGTGPQIRVVVYPRSEAVAGRRYRWPADPEVGAGRRCLESQPCESAVSGEINFRPTGSDTALEGSILLHFAAGDSIIGGFRAEWRPRQMLCG